MCYRLEQIQQDRATLTTKLETFGQQLSKLVSVLFSRAQIYRMLPLVPVLYIHPCLNDCENRCWKMHTQSHF